MVHPTDITPLTFLDYPQKAACIFWYNGCNLRCPYCYNPDLALAHNRGVVDQNHLIAYVALDHKMPSDRTWKLPDGSMLYDKFRKSLQLLVQSKLPHEVRTTVHPALLDESDILRMIHEAQNIGYSGTYYLQFFFKTEHTLGHMAPPTRRYDRVALDKFSPLKIGYRNFPEDRGK